MAYKILAISINSKLTKESERIIEKYQSSFRSGKGIVGQRFALREIQAESLEQKKKKTTISIFKTSIHKVDREQVLDTLKEINIHDKTVDKIIAMINLTLHRSEDTANIKEKLPKKCNCSEFCFCSSRKSYTSSKYTQRRVDVP